MTSPRTMTRWLSEGEAAEHAGMSPASFRKYVLPRVRPVKYSKRLVRYDSVEVDQAIAELRGEGPPSSDKDKALEALYEDRGARR